MKKRYGERQSSSLVPQFEKGTECFRKGMTPGQRRAYDRWREKKMQEPGYVSLTQEQLEEMERREQRMKERNDPPRTP